MSRDLEEGRGRAWWRSEDQRSGRGTFQRGHCVHDRSRERLTAGAGVRLGVMGGEVAETAPGRFEGPWKGRGLTPLSTLWAAGGTLRDFEQRRHNVIWKHCLISKTQTQRNCAFQGRAQG